MTTNYDATHRHFEHSQASTMAPAAIRRGRAFRVAIAALTTVALTLPVFANDGGSIIKKRRDRDVTVIIIDDNDRNKKRIMDEASRSPDRGGIIKRRDDGIRIIHRDDRKNRRSTTDSNGTRDANGIIKRPDNEIRVRLPRGNGSGSDHSSNSGPKVIIIDRNSSACKGSGVCVIRP